VPKLRGTARERLREVLRRWGAADEAVRLSRSRSSVRRCRGLHRLGVLADGSRRDDVLARLDDRDFAVRRSAVLALGAFPEPVVVERLLQRAAREPRLRADFLASVDRIGAPAVAVLRRGLTHSLAATPGGDRRGFLAAEALGLVGAVSTVPVLEQALQRASEELTVACIHALGMLGAASSVVALAGPLEHADPGVRRAAAESLGLIGGPWAVPALGNVLLDENVEVARAAANALHQCGPLGRDVLAASSAPVAREVVALAALGSVS
jgi:HEAT repeat protein